jgi:hypothetical protein
MQNTIRIGSIWTCSAIGADTRLIMSWLASDLSYEDADALVKDLKFRTYCGLQISTDGLPFYLETILKKLQVRRKRTTAK